MRFSLLSCTLLATVFLPSISALAEGKSRPANSPKQETRPRRWKFPVARPAVRQLDISRVPLPPLPVGISELKFGEFFKMPVGPRGLKVSEALQKLDGRKVRVLGFQVREQIGDCVDCAKPSRPGTKPRPAWIDHLVPGRLLLSPVSSTINMGHYGLSDDLPPQTLYVTAPDFFGEPVPFTPGLLLLTGTLSIGNKVEANGRISVVPPPARRTAPGGRARSFDRAIRGECHNHQTRESMTKTQSIRVSAAALALASAIVVPSVQAAPAITRFSPPSGLFSFNDPNPPYIARFLPGQRFDIQVTIRPDAGQTITGVKFKIDGKAIRGSVTLAPATAPGLPAGTVIATLRAFSSQPSGAHVITATATQNDAQEAEAATNFETVEIEQIGKKIKNVIVMIGDGMGATHRTAARIVANGVMLGKANAPLAMDTFPHTAMIMTASLNSIVTDSSPGAACYASGNKANNNQQNVFPDDTVDNFDNPRVEHVGEYLARTQGKALGIVTTSDVFDATPASFASHTSNRGAGTGICDQFLDEASRTGLRVLLGGGRKWFLPNTTPGSARGNGTDYILPTDLATAWGVPAGALDPSRDLLADFASAGFIYAADGTALQTQAAGATKLLGLFALSNMNVAYDKVNGRRGASTVVNDFGFPNQPMLDEMTGAALTVLDKSAKGFVLMVEAASIDKQAHNMDTERWILDTIEFDNAIAVAQAYAAGRQDTLVIITADHECAGAALIGASRVKNATLEAAAANGGGTAQLRDNLVGIYEAAGFPQYSRAADGYPTTMDVDFRLLVGYGGNGDRYEDWLTNALPANDSQQPFNNVVPLSTYPQIAPTGTGSRPIRDAAGNFLVTGQVPGSSAVHTASDIPLSAFGLGASLFGGTMDNTDVFFRYMQGVIGGTR